MQLSRLIETVFLLLNRDSVTARELSERFEISARTVYRDIDALSLSGIPVITDRGKGGGIRIAEGYKLKNTLLTADEQSEIIAALKAGSITGSKEAAAALTKLASVFHAKDRDYIEVDFSDWYNRSVERENFESLKSAILSAHAVTFDYYNQDGIESTRSILPYRLLYKHLAWYVYGFCRLKNQERLFRLSRISSLKISDETFEYCGTLPPPGQTAGNFNADDVRLKLRVDQCLISRIYDDFGKSDAVKQRDGSYLVTVNVPKSDWILGYILSYGDKAEILEPASMRMRLQETANAILKKYL